MRRRTFLEISGLAWIGGTLAGCAESTTRLSVSDDAATGATDAAMPAPDVGPAHDAAVLVAEPDAGSPTDDASTALYVLTTFTVVLNDTSCSGHDHECIVSAGMYADDTPLAFNGAGSHRVVFRPSELLRIQNGEQIPFATSGPGPNHGHCGLAFREGLYVASRDRVDTCQVLAPPSGPRAVCGLHPRG